MSPVLHLKWQFTIGISHSSFPRRSSHSRRIPIEEALLAAWHLCRTMWISMSFSKASVAITTLLTVFPIPANADMTLRSSGICYGPSNNCSQSWRCHLHDSIAFSSGQPPSWAPEALKTLFSTTIDQARTSTLPDLGSYNSPSGFHPQMACWLSSTVLVWSTSWSINAGPCLSAWGALGFHPYGNATGTWLTLIVANPSVKLYLYKPDDFYVSIIKINDTQPIESFGLYKTLDAYKTTVDANWKLFRNTFPVENVWGEAIRTDNDLIMNGYDVACCQSMYCDAQTYMTANDPLWANWTLMHFSCPDIGFTWTQNTTDMFRFNDTYGGYRCPYTPYSKYIGGSGSVLRKPSTVLGLVGTMILFSLLL
jgi:hypothetical protein